MIKTKTYYRDRETHRHTNTHMDLRETLDFLLRIIFRSIVYSSCSGGYYIWYFFITAAAATDSITITRRHIASVNHYTEKDNEIRKIKIKKTHNRNEKNEMNKWKCDPNWIDHDLARPWKSDAPTAHAVRCYSHQ